MANLAGVCDCPIRIVGKTEDDLLQNFERHVKDVHKSELTDDLRLALGRATKAT